MAGEEAKYRFKVGFLRKFAELGYDPTDVEHLLLNMEKKATPVGAALSGVLGSVPALTLLALGVPLFAGAGTGALRAHFTSPSKSDINEAKSRELQTAYERAISDIERRMEVR